MSDVKHSQLEAQESLRDCLQDDSSIDGKVPVKPPRRKSLGANKAKNLHNKSNYTIASDKNQQVDKVISSSKNVINVKTDLATERKTDENAKVMNSSVNTESNVYSSVKKCPPQPKPRRIPPPIPLIKPNAKPIDRHMKSPPGKIENVVSNKDQTFDQSENIKPNSEVFESLPSDNKKTYLSDSKNKKSKVSVLRSKSIKWAGKLGIQKKETVSKSNRRASYDLLSTNKQDPALNTPVKKVPSRPKSFSNVNSSNLKKRPSRPPPPQRPSRPPPPRPPSPSISPYKISQTSPNSENPPKKVVDVKMKSFISSQGEFVARQDNNDFTQLEFKKGDRLFVMRELGNGLVFGRNEISGEEGTFPLEMAQQLLDKNTSTTSLENKSCPQTKLNDISFDESKQNHTIHLKNDCIQSKENRENMRISKNNEEADFGQIRSSLDVETFKKSTVESIDDENSLIQIIPNQQTSVSYENKDSLNLNEVDQSCS